MINKFAVLTLVLILHAAGARAWERPLDVVLHEAVRPSKTTERNEQKLAAKAELIDRMPDSMRAAMRYVHGDNVMLQVLVMEWVTQLPSETIVPVLLEFIDDENVETRRVAIFFLGFHQTPEHAEKILPYLDDEKCRGATIRTLGKWKIAAARVPIEHWLSAGKERVRVVAANALRDIGDPEAIPALMEALSDPVFTVRNTAARALVSFGDAGIAYMKNHPDAAYNEVMVKRCLADLDQVPESDVLEAEHVRLDGKFFLP